MGADRLIRKLSSFISLPDKDCAQLEHLAASARRFPARGLLIREGDQPDAVFLLLDGWAYRYKLLRDGGRQILAYLIPGDLCDIHIFILKRMDHSIGLLTNATVAVIPKADMLATLRDFPAIAEALFWSTLVDEAIAREWLVNLGQRDAYDRIAHLFCEMAARMH